MYGFIYSKILWFYQTNKSISATFCSSQQICKIGTSSRDKNEKKWTWIIVNKWLKLYNGFCFFFRWPLKRYCVAYICFNVFFIIYCCSTSESKQITVFFFLLLVNATLCKATHKCIGHTRKKKERIDKIHAFMI